MMPDEDYNRAEIAKKLAPVIMPAATTLLDIGREVTGKLPKAARKKHTPILLRSIAGLVAQATLHYRGIFVVAELALDEPAAMLTRSILEDILAERFILRRPTRRD